LRRVFLRFPVFSGIFKLMLEWVSFGSVSYVTSYTYLVLSVVFNKADCTRAFAGTGVLVALARPNPVVQFFTTLGSRHDSSPLNLGVSWRRPRYKQVEVAFLVLRLLHDTAGVHPSTDENGIFEHEITSLHSFSTHHAFTYRGNL
jgi:hypothetical protein